MASKTTITCDLCSVEITAEERHQRWTVFVSIASYDSRGYGGDVKANADCCRPCAERLGFLPKFDALTRKPIPVAPPSTEDLLRELLARVGVESQP